MLVLQTKERLLRQAERPQREDAAENRRARTQPKPKSAPH
jgi:hypothetical protein